MSRIEDLRRRVEQDPASIAFAQLAEEYRRAGDRAEAVRVCEAGLALHPAYLSARVTLGRALLELERLNEARVEFERVLDQAPDNLLAQNKLAEIRDRAPQLATPPAEPPLDSPPMETSESPEVAPDPVLLKLEAWLAVIDERRQDR